MSLTLNEDELRAILGEVEKDLETVLKSEQVRLAKADPEKSPEGSPEASPEASPEGSTPPMESSPEGTHSEAAESAPAESAPVDPSAAPEAAPEEDLETKLAALPEEQLMHLYRAVKQAVFAKMPAPAPEAAPVSPSPAAPAAPPMASPAPVMPPAMKAEMKSSPGNGGKMDKSEQQLQDLKAQLEGLTKAVTILAGAPLRKAITSVAHLPKNDGQSGKKDVSSLSKSEVTAKLVEKTRDPQLSKKDRESINGFYDGRFGLDKIAHLLQ